MKRTLVLIGALVACLSVAGIVQAAPGKKNVRSTVSIRSAGSGDYTEGFTGKVGSRSGACRAGRRVVVKQQGGGRVGAAVTNRQGRYAVPIRGQYAESGRYFARVGGKRLNRRTKCAAARSDTVRVTGS